MNYYFVPGVQVDAGVINVAIVADGPLTSEKIATGLIETVRMQYPLVMLCLDWDDFGIEEIDEREYLRLIESEPFQSEPEYLKLWSMGERDEYGNRTEWFPPAGS